MDAVKLELVFSGRTCPGAGPYAGRPQLAISLEPLKLTVRRNAASGDHSAGGSAADGHRRGGGGCCEVIALSEGLAEAVLLDAEEEAEFHAAIAAARGSGDVAPPLTQHDGARACWALSAAGLALPLSCSSGGVALVPVRLRGAEETFEVDDEDSGFGSSSGLGAGAGCVRYLPLASLLAEAPAEKKV